MSVGQRSSEARGLKVFYRQIEGEGHLFDIFFRGFTLQAYLERGKGRLLPIERHKFFSRDR